MATEKEIKQADFSTWDSARIQLVKKSELDALLGKSVFAVHRATSNQTPLVQNTWDVVEFNTEASDDDGYFDSTTNYRFQPTVAGWWRLSSRLRITSDTLPGLDFTGIAVFKNGSAAKIGDFHTIASGQDIIFDHVGVTALLYFDGSSDYADIRAYTQGAGNCAIYLGADYSFFDGERVA